MFFIVFLKIFKGLLLVCFLIWLKVLYKIVDVVLCLLFNIKWLIKCVINLELYIGFVKILCFVGVFFFGI